jgi:hypothetical protein
MKDITHAIYVASGYQPTNLQLTISKAAVDSQNFDSCLAISRPRAMGAIMLREAASRFRELQGIR